MLVYYYEAAITTVYLKGFAATGYSSTSLHMVRSFAALQAIAYYFGCNEHIVIPRKLQATRRSALRDIVELQPAVSWSDIQQTNPFMRFTGNPTFLDKLAHDAFSADVSR